MHIDAVDLDAGCGEAAEHLGIATPDTTARGAEPMVMLDALLGSDHNFHHFEAAIRTWGREAVVEGRGRGSDEAPAVPDRLRRARRLSQLRHKMVLREQFGDLEAARQVLEKLADVLDDIDVEEEDDSPKPGRRRKAER